MEASKDIRAAGIPAVTFVNVHVGYPGERGEIAVDSNAVSVFEAGDASSRHEGYAGVFEKSISEHEVCEGILGPEAAVNPMAACVGDGATILMLVVGSRKTKKHIFNKRTLLPFVSNELFAAIQDKTGSVIGSYETAVRLSSFEIQDEIVTDLLRPTNRGLVVSATPEEGVVVAGLTNETHTTEMTLQRALEGACDNRATHTLPPGGSIDSSACVWELELIQDEEVAGGSVRSSRSKFVVCEIPATDPLVLSASEMRQLDGPSLHKSLTTFVDVARKLTSPQLASIAPFRSSKLTHYLSEMLGGNAVVMALSHIIPGESRVSRKTLEITSDIAQSVHFPITGHDMTGVLRGLLTKYRSLILQLQDEIANGAPIGDAPPELSEKRLSELQSELAQAHILKNQTKEDYTRLYEMMTMLKEKYKTLAEQKGTQSQELIKAEEERLNVARALVELKLEHSNLLESTENEKFELSSSLLAAKSEIYDLDAQLVTSKSEAASAKEAAYELELLLKTEQQELAAVTAAMAEVKNQLEKENIKNVELGSELLTLVNQKDELKKSVESLQQKLDLAAIKLTSAVTEVAEKEKAVNELRESNRTLEDDIGELKRLETDHEVEFKRLVGELDRTKDELDKMTGEFMKEKETIYESARTAAEDEIRNAQLETEEVGGLLRKADKRQRDLERTIQRLQWDMDKVSEALAASTVEADEVRDKYRTRLEQLFAPGAVSADEGAEAKYGAVGELPSVVDESDAAAAAAEGVDGLSTGEDGANALSMIDAVAAAKAADEEKEKGKDSDDDDNDSDLDNDEEKEEKKKKKEEEEEEEEDAAAAAAVAEAETKTEEATKEGAAEEAEKAEGVPTEGGDAAAVPEPVTSEAPTEDKVVLEALVSSYNEKETAVVGHLGHERQENRGMKKAYRALFDKYQQLLDVLEENFPTHLPPATDLVDELELLMQCGVTGNLDEDDQTVEMVEKMKLAEKALQDEQARAAGLVDGFKIRLDRESAKVIALNEENSMLRAENEAKSMTKQFELLQASLKAQLEQQQDEMLAAQLSMRGKSSAVKEQSLEETLKEQAAKREEEARAKEEAEAAEKARLQAAEAEVGRMAELEAEVVKLRADLAKSNAFAGLGDDMTGVTEVSVAQFSAVRARLLDAEKIKAQAEARIISLEDELKQYNQYMRDSAVMYRRQVATLKQQGRQYHVAIQELQVRFNEANSLLSESKRDIEIYRSGGVPVHATPSTPILSLPLDGAPSDVIEAPLESVREDEEDEEEDNNAGDGAGAGVQSAPSTPMVPPRPTADGADVENQPPSNTPAPDVPALKLPMISDPEVTGGKDEDDGPVSARLEASDEALHGEAKKLVDGQVLSARLESGEDPSTVLPELIKKTDKPDEPDTSAAAGLAAEVEKEESTE